jgi:hypothetical protein
MIEDVDKTRVEYVTRLELLVQNLQRQIAELQAEERWIPKFGSTLNTGGSCEEAQLTLSFGGKNQTAVFTYDFLKEHGAIDATTNIIELGFKNMILDRFREVVQPEVERLQTSVKSISRAGRW